MSIALYAFFHEGPFMTAITAEMKQNKHRHTVVMLSTHTQFVSILSSFGTESKSIHFTLYDWPVVNLLNTRNVEVSTLPFLNSQIDTNDSFLSHRNSANDVIGNCVLFPVHAIT